MVVTEHGVRLKLMQWQQTAPCNFPPTPHFWNFVIMSRTNIKSAQQQVASASPRMWLFFFFFTSVIYCLFYPLHSSLPCSDFTPYKDSNEFDFASVTKYNMWKPWSEKYDPCALKGLQLTVFLLCLDIFTSSATDSLTASAPFVYLDQTEIYNITLTHFQRIHNGVSSREKCFRDYKTPAEDVKFRCQSLICENKAAVPRLPEKQWREIMIIGEGHQSFCHQQSL